MIDKIASTLPAPVLRALTHHPGPEVVAAATVELDRRGEPLVELTDWADAPASVRALGPEVLSTLAEIPTGHGLHGADSIAEAARLRLTLPIHQ